MNSTLLSNCSTALIELLSTTKAVDCIIKGKHHFIAPV